MREVKRHALVGYSPAQMFALVADFERYPEFLPWVADAKLVSREGNELVGRLDMAKLGVHEHFTTRNMLDEPHRMDMTLVDGPFQVLEGHWQFIAIEDGAGQVRGARVELLLRFAFKSHMLELLIGKAFEASCSSLVEAFVKRARALYG